MNEVCDMNNERSNREGEMMRIGSIDNYWFLTWKCMKIVVFKEAEDVQQI